jgi:hypothetical protein
LPCRCWKSAPGEASAGRIGSQTGAEPASERAEKTLVPSHDHDANDRQSETHRKAATFPAANDNRVDSHRGDVAGDNRHDCDLECLKVTAGLWTSEYPKGLFG